MLKEGFKMPDEEISRRFSNVRREMAEKEIEVLVVFSAPGSMRYGQIKKIVFRFFRFMKLFAAMYCISPGLNLTLVIV